MTSSSSLPLTQPASPASEATLRSVLRIVAGFLYGCHGAAKLFGVLGGAGGPAAGGHGATVHLWSLQGLAGVIEFVGGTLIMIGLFTRVAAFIASGEMACAYFIVHFPRAFHNPDAVWPIVNRGELAVLFCFLFLYFAFAGPGPYSLDAVRQRRRALTVDRPEAERLDGGSVASGRLS
jgi:putative oxidoreductase